MARGPVPASRSFILPHLQVSSRMSKVPGAPGLGRGHPRGPLLSPLHFCFLSLPSEPARFIYLFNICYLLNKVGIRVLEKKKKRGAPGTWLAGAPSLLTAARALGLDLHPGTTGSRCPSGRTGTVCAARGHAGVSSSAQEPHTGWVALPHSVWGSHGQSLQDQFPDLGSQSLSELWEHKTAVTQRDQRWQVGPSPPGFLRYCVCLRRVF